MSEVSGRGRLAADGVLVLITALWGLTFAVVQDALGDADPMTFLAVRFAIGGAVATALARGALFDAANLRAGLLLGVLLWAGYVFQTVGLLYTTPARSAFITGLCVVLVPPISIVVLKRWPRGPSWLGVALAVAGLAVLTGALEGEATAQQRRGDLLTLGCAAVFGVHITLTERYSKTLKATSLVAVQLWVVSLLSLASLPFVEVRVEWTRGLWFALAVCGVLASAVAISVQTWAQARTTAVRAALIFTLEPVVAAFYSVLTGREALTARVVVGGGLMILAVVVAELSTLLLDRWRRQRLGFTSS